MKFFCQDIYFVCQSNKNYFVMSTQRTENFQVGILVLSPQKLIGELWDNSLTCKNSSVTVKIKFKNNISKKGGIMRKLELMWRKRGSVLLALLSSLLLATSFIGCGGGTDAPPPPPPPQTPAFSAATQAEFKTAVDNALAAATWKRGISVAVYKNGYQMWTYAAGLSDGVYGTGTGTAMTPSTPAYAYSITKTIVSALILTQISNGLYTLDSTVDSLLITNADYRALSPGQQARINKNATVRQLLTHTSGMRDYATNINPLILMCNPATAWKPADILEKIVNEDNDPTYDSANIGTFIYSNTNYVLLGMIAQQMDPTKWPLHTLLAANFFTPLGINALLAPKDAYPAGVIAHPYDDAWLFGDKLIPGTPPLGSFIDFSEAIKTYVHPAFDFYLGVGRGTWAAGGIISTASELAKWGYQLYDANGSAVTAAVRTQLKNSALTNGAYGYGVSYTVCAYTDASPCSTYGHGGSAPGYRTLLRYENNKQITVAILTNVNNSGLDPGAIIDRETLAVTLFDAYNKNK